MILHLWKRKKGCHSDSPNTPNKVPNDTLEVIREIFCSGLTKPLQVIAELERLNIEPIKITKLKGILKKCRTEKYGKNLKNYDDF